MPRVPAQDVPTDAASTDSVADSAFDRFRLHVGRPDAAAVWLIADIGGTHSRFARIGPDGLPAGQMRLRNEEFSGLPHALEAALGSPGPRIDALALAVACPVEHGPIRLTNRDWGFDAASLRAATGVRQVRIVNDFVAAGAGLHGLREPDVIKIDDTVGESAHRRATGVRIVLGPGTGLGLSGLVRCASGWRALESEAGHAACPTVLPEALPALQAVRARFGRASWERLLSGDGLAQLDAGLRGDGPRTAAQVANSAQAGDAAAVRATRAFSQLLGEFAGDACLTLRADAVYLTGGVLDGLGAAFDARAFRDGFVDKGRFASMMRGVPVLRVTVGDLALRGMAAIVAGAVEAPGVAEPGAAGGSDDA